MGYYHCRGCVTARRRLYRSSDVRHLEHRASLLGPRQETCPKEALPISELEHIFLKVHPHPRALFREVRPRVQHVAAENERDPSEGRRLAGNRAVGGQGFAFRGPEMYLGGREDHPRGFLATEWFH